MRGQIHNLVEALRRQQSPFDLARMPPLTIQERTGSRDGLHRRILAFSQRGPRFQWC